MKRLTYLVALLVLIPSSAKAQSHTLKWLRINNLHHKVLNTGHQGQRAGGRWGQHVYYYTDSFTRANYASRGWQVGVRDWKNEEGETYPVKTAGATILTSSPTENTMPVPLDEAGNTIKRYFRTKPSEVKVGGFKVSPPFPLRGDEVAPEKIPGTADVMVESKIRLPMGIEIHQRVLAWTQENHDDYIVFDWTFTNTGNVDFDSDIELPDQTLKDVYFMRGADARPNQEGVPWWSYYGAKPEDSLRIAYAYNEWRTNAPIDDFGRPDRATGNLEGAEYVGEAILHVDESVDSESNDPSQPFMTGHTTMEINWFKAPFEQTSPSQWKTLYTAMSEGFGPIFGSEMMEGTYPNARHMAPMDQWATDRGLSTPQEVDYQWHPGMYYSIGPYQMEPGDNFRIVWGTTMGALSPKAAWDIGQAWVEGSLTWNGQNNLPPQAELVYSQIGPTEVDKAKDHWVATGKDSLFTNAAHAQWAVRNDYQVPTAPPAPNLSVVPQPNQITLEWDGTASEQVPDFAGYRVYRAVGNPGPTVINDALVGEWELLKEIKGAGTHSYADTEAERGQAYFYYVTAFDDGESNRIGVNGKKEVLESGRYMNMTTQAAHLTRPPKSLEEVRVVPNPFSRQAENSQFVGEPDKIMFMNLPPECTIRIYTESGDLVKTIEHTDGSGDEPWGDIPDEHSVTETGQIIVSGLYIAHIETPSGESNIVKFAVVR